MSIQVQKLTQALISTEKTAESVVKLVKLLKQCVEMYGELTGQPVVKKTAGEKTEFDTFLKQLAEQWIQLPKDTRRDLIDPVRTEATGNDTLFVKEIFGQLILLASMTQPVANLGLMLGKVLKNQEKILKQLETINERLKAIEIRLDERILSDARTAIIHLNDAANVRGKSVRDQSLQSASAIFTKLTALDPNQMTQGTSGTIQNRALIALGYWGRHLILGMQDETRYALVQVYECTQKYPLEGMLVFPPDYFSKDYKAEIDVAKVHEAMAHKQLDSTQRANRQAQIERGLEMAGGVSLVVLGIAALFTGNTSVMQAGFRSLQGGSQVYSDASKKSTSPFDELAPALKALSMKQTRERLAKEITAECSSRLQFLGRIEVADLREIILVPA